jgi:hypothetical protein
MRWSLILVQAVLTLALIAPVAGVHADPLSRPIKVGIIGLDAHAVPWTKIINDPQAAAPISAMKVVAAYPAYSPDVPFSNDNIQKNIELMRKMGVEITDSIPMLLAKVDAVLLLSIDGRPHPEQARPVWATRKPLFIDKPIAPSLAEIIEIYRQAEASGTPLFASSSLRYGPGLLALLHSPKIGRVLGCDAYSNSKSILPGHPDLFYYGIHGVEMLFTVMGPGCLTVARAKTDAGDIAVGVWRDGRLGTYRGIRQGQVGFGATVFGEKGIDAVHKFEGYEGLLAEIARFFQTGKPPLGPQQTLEIYAFLEGADESMRLGGQPVTLESVLAKAHLEVDARPKAP